MVDANWLQNLSKHELRVCVCLCVYVCCCSYGQNGSKVITANGVSSFGKANNNAGSCKDNGGDSDKKLMVKKLLAFIWNIAERKREEGNSGLSAIQ